MFVNIGFGNFINSSQIVSICRADSAPMKRMVSEARSKGSAVDATQGRKTKSVMGIFQTKRISVPKVIYCTIVSIMVL